MPVIELADDDLLDGGKYVKLSVVASAIAKNLLANGSPNRFQAERDAWPFIHTGIVSNKLHPLDQTNLQPLSPDNSGDGMVLFDELVEWGQWCKRFDFEKQAAPAASGKYEPLCSLLANYWDKPRSELPENLQARVSKREVPGHYEYQEKRDVNGELERDAQGHYPVWEEVYIKRFVGEWLFDWDKMTPEDRKTCARNIDDKHKIKTKEQSEIDAAYTQAAYVETGLNGASINWRYWVHQMPVLSAAQAACLMSALEPDLFANLDGQPGHNDPTEYIQKARKIQRLAEALGKLTASPAEWVEWAQSLNPPIKVHIGFLLAVRYPPESSTGQNEAAKKAEATTGSGGVAAKVEDEKQAEAVSDANEETLAWSGLKAEEVTISFVGNKADSGLGANNMLDISARGKTKRFGLFELDLIDKRGGTINEAGIILLGLAQNEKLANRGNPIAMSQKVSRLRKALKSNLGIVGDPFNAYNKHDGWLPRFKIIDSRGKADERAKQEAERRTVSYEEMSERGHQFAESNDYPYEHESDEAGQWINNQTADLS